MIIRAFLPLVALGSFTAFIALSYFDTVRKLPEARRLRRGWLSASIVLAALSAPWAKYVPCELGTVSRDADGCNLCLCEFDGKSCLLVRCVTQSQRR
jgi:hypothetical protein